jgi:hypothetical protein
MDRRLHFVKQGRRLIISYLICIPMNPKSWTSVCRTFSWERLENETSPGRSLYLVFNSYIRKSEKKTIPPHFCFKCDHF